MLDRLDYVFDYTIYIQSVFFDIRDILKKAESLPLSGQLSACLLELYKAYSKFVVVMQIRFLNNLNGYI